ncbi:MAG TPA: hypothetical protein PKB13_08170 [Clostridia bacterium]|nr:hypothetical protein [Clostridia bacterium]
MDWGKIIMDTITAAIITVAGVVLAALITELFLAKKVKKQIGSHSDTSSMEHKEIKAYVKEKEQNTVKEVKAFFEHQKELNNLNYQSLSKDQAQIAQSVNAIQFIPQELARLNNELAHFSEQVKELRQEKQTLQQENTKLRNELSRERAKHRNPVR